MLDVEVCVSNHSITRCHRVFCHTSRSKPEMPPEQCAWVPECRSTWLFKVRLMCCPRRWLLPSLTDLHFATGSHLRNRQPLQFIKTFKVSEVLAIKVLTVLMASAAESKTLLLSRHLEMVGVVLAIIGDKPPQQLPVLLWHLPSLTQNVNVHHLRYHLHRCRLGLLHKKKRWTLFPHFWSTKDHILLVQTSFWSITWPFLMTNIFLPLYS